MFHVNILMLLRLEKESIQGEEDDTFEKKGVGPPVLFSFCFFQPPKGWKKGCKW